MQTLVTLTQVGCKQTRLRVRAVFMHQLLDCRLAHNCITVLKNNQEVALMYSTAVVKAYRVIQQGSMNQIKIYLWVTLKEVCCICVIKENANLRHDKHIIVEKLVMCY